MDQWMRGLAFTAGLAAKQPVGDLGVVEGQRVDQVVPAVMKFLEDNI